MVAKLAAHLVLELAQVLGHLAGQAIGHGPLLQVIAAGVGGNDETGGNGQSQVGHFRQVGALAA